MSRRNRQPHEWKYLPPSRTGDMRGVWRRGDGAEVRRGLKHWYAILRDGAVVRVEAVDPSDVQKSLREFSTARLARAYLDGLWRR